MAVEVIIASVLFIILFVLASALSVALFFNPRKCKSQFPFVLWSTFNTLFTWVTAATNLAIHFMTTLTPRTVFTLAVLGSATVLTFQYHSETLQYADDAWRIWAYPLLRDILEPLLLLLRLMYNTLIPLYNMAVIVLAQLTLGTAGTLVNCELEGLYDPLHHFANGTVAMAHGLSHFLKHDDRKIDLTEGYQQYLLAISELDDGIKCACSEIAPATEALLYGGRIDAMSRALNEATNVPILFVHEIVEAFDTGRPPTFDATMDSLSAAIVEAAIGADDWSFHAVEKLHALKRVQMVHAPKEAVFSTGARLLVGAAIAPIHAVARGTLNLLNSPSNEQIVNGYNMDIAWRNLYIAAHDLGETAHFWLGTYTEQAQYTPYSCDWADDESISTFGTFSNTVACTAENTAKAGVGAIHVLYDTVMEAVFLEDQPYDLFRILQRHDGEWGAPTCGCQCDMGLGSWRNSTLYNGWCNTPTLQAQVFAPLETAVVKLGRGTLGPVSYIATTPLRALIELARISTRTILSINQLVSGHWAYLPLGCGYGESTLSDCVGRMFTPSVSECARGANFSPDCMCNYLDAPQDSDQCQCIATYPAMDADIVAFERASPNWCNAMYLEHGWKLIDEVGVATERLLHSVGENMGVECNEFEVSLLSTTSHLGDMSLNDNTACEVWGNHNFVCSGGSAARAAVRGAVNLARQLSGDAIRLFEGDVSTLQLDFAPRICDFEKFLAYSSSVAGNALLFATPAQRVAFSKIGFAALDGTLAAPLKMVHAAYFAIVDIVQLSENGGFEARYIGDSAKTTMVDIINVVFDVVNVGLDAFAEFFDTLGNTSPRPGEFFRDVKVIVSNFKNIITNDVLDMFTDLVDIFVRLLNIITGNGSARDVSRVLKDVMDIVKKFSEAIVAEYMSFLDVVFAFLGEFGDFLKSLSGDICGVVKTIATTFGQGDSVVCFKHGGRRRMLASDGPHITEWVSTHVVWDGDSVCDILMRETTDAFESLRVLERATWTDCLQKRAIGDKIANFVQLPSLHLHDMLYNYKRKYMLLWEFARHILATRGVTSRMEAYEAFVRNNMNTDVHMAMYDWKFIHWDRLIGATTATFDVKEMVDTAQLWRDWQLLADVGPQAMNTVLVAEFALNTQNIQRASGAPIDTGTIQCDGATCTKCTALDNLADVVAREASQIADFYGYAYPQLLQDVENFRFEPVGAFEGGTIFNVQDAINPMRWQHVRDDWASLANGTNGVMFVLDAVNRFMTTTNNSYVPLFGVGGAYIVLGPIFESCDAEEMLYYDPQKSAERKDAVGSGMIAVAIYFVVLTMVPFGTPLLSTMALVFGSALVYLYTVYGYLPSCVPSLPYTLLDDLYAWMNDNRASQHLCEYVPDLYDGSCGAQNNTLSPPYRSCESMIPTFRSVGDDDWGTLWWPALTWLRHTFGAAPWLDGIHRYASGDLYIELEKWRAGAGLSDVEVQCMHVMSPAIPFTFFVAYIFVALPVRLGITLFKSIVDGVIMINSLYEFFRTIVSSVMSDEDEAEKKGI